MKKIKAILLALLMSTSITVASVSLSGCDLNALSNFVDSSKITLLPPTNLRMENGSLTWNPVDHASKYTVSIDGKEYFCEDNIFPLDNVTDGEHVVKVKANGDGIMYITSAYCQEITITILEGAEISSGAYEQFDELTKNESFLGYGFDVINSAVFSDKYVKTSFPIFKTDELMNQRLLKVNSKQTYVEEVESSDMEEFLSDWNANANVNVGWGGKKIGGSVDVAAKYAGGVENARSKYFHAISFYNQKFYIVMQSDMQTYKEIISNSFKQDLYSDLEPAQLFDRYGTHFITSAVMGGKINSYYLYSSEEEKSYHDISAEVSTEVRAKVNKTNVDVAGGYKQTAQNENIYIKNTLEVIGGGNHAMISDDDIAANYKAWENSLEENPSLMGIKDTGSLIPVWELIDSSLDTKTYMWDYGEGYQGTGTRAQQLQAYFQSYGVESYNQLMDAAGLPELISPKEIVSVKVNNQDIVGDEYQVFAGTINDITFSVSPANATAYTKSIQLTNSSDYGRIENGQLIIDSNAPQGTTFTVKLSAGSTQKTIVIKVANTYSVVFQSNGGSEVAPITGLTYGEQIEEPTPPTRDQYQFAGWYTDPDFAQGTKYKFGQQSVQSNFTLYAKWNLVVSLSYEESPNWIVGSYLGGITSDTYGKVLRFSWCNLEELIEEGYKYEVIFNYTLREAYESGSLGDEAAGAQAQVVFAVGNSLDNCSAVKEQWHDGNALTGSGTEKSFSMSYVGNASELSEKNFLYYFRASTWGTLDTKDAYVVLHYSISIRFYK